jgi:hypothetical protein
VQGGREGAARVNLPLPRFIPRPPEGDDVPEWPGLHPGTGFNDHGPHPYVVYWARTRDGRFMLFRACQVCGWPEATA